VIGMTKLARGAQMAYASLVMVTDYDCWHPREAHVTTELAIANLMKNAERAQQILVSAIGLTGKSCPPSDAHSALKMALVTPINALPSNKQSVVQTLLI